MYFKKYKFLYERKFKIKSLNLNENFKYDSMIYLNNFFNENNKNYYHLMELDINAELNGKKLGKEVLLLYVFSSLIIGISFDDELAKIYNEKNLLYRLKLIGNTVKNERKLVEKLREYEKIIVDEKILSMYINNKKYINLLFLSPHKKSNEKEYNLKYFFIDFYLPLRITKKTKSNIIEYTGEIDFFKIKKEEIVNYFKENYISIINNYIFSYKLIISFRDNKIENIYCQINFDTEEGVKLEEKIKIFSEDE